MTVTRPYGTWPSPVTADALVQGSVRLGGVATAGGAVYWLEGRPHEGGRSVLVRRREDGDLQDLNAAPFNIRSRVHEYGGGAFLVTRDRVWFSNDADRRIYEITDGGPPRAVSPEGGFRYADMVLDEKRARLLCIREDHSATSGEPQNAVVAVDLHDGKVKIIASGQDFYSNPRLCPDGTRLAYLAWNHPRMPWDGTELFVCEVAADGAVGEPTKVAGGASESVFQPEWSPSGELYFVSDQSGWWNLYRMGGNDAVNVLPMDAEFGRPQWVFGMRTYGFSGDGSVLACCCRQGIWELLAVSRDGSCRSIATPFSDIDDIAVSADRAILIAGAPDRPGAVVALDSNSGDFEILRASTEVALEDAYVSIHEPVRFASGRGEEAHGFFYAPKNPEFAGSATDRPPLIVIGHGGPTGAASTTLRLAIQFWTTRGFAVLDVNYRGSTGFGRVYRESLYGHWGVADVADCVHGAQHLVKQGRVDGNRLIIRGNSAGGYTTLAALTFHDVFKAGASYYGIGELEALARDTHKFESRYLDQLVGPYPESRDLYAERSPLNFTELLSCPVIFFQGLEDEVVPPNQAQMMVDALQDKGIPVAYLAFEGEQHGFRKAETIVRTAEAELYFYGRVLGFPPADEIEPVEIKNLSDGDTRSR
jgi:dipeptidyl aminopeptidase/acylaminoacyl peptidase